MFEDIGALLRKFVQLGAVRAFCKPLAENDNSKQQIYLGSSFEAIQMFPFHDIRACKERKIENYKAGLSLWWVTDSEIEEAKEAQLILYPQYPEVRLSGFLKGCRLAPNEFLRHVPAAQRRFNNGPDGRVMFFGITSDGRTLTFLAPADTPLTREFMVREARGEFVEDGVFYLLKLPGLDSKQNLLRMLSEIRAAGWHESMRLNSNGERVAYRARNGGGYTLEALLGIIPNGRAEPDYLGWELKAYSSSRITLMTPEPDGGLYGDRGVEAFVRAYGRAIPGDVLYFTGTHKAGIRNDSTGMTLVLNGYDPVRNVISDVNGAIELQTDSGTCAASWSYGSLILGWNKKHDKAAYVPYETDAVEPIRYKYNSPCLMGEGTDFARYLAALHSGSVIFDPGSKVMDASTAHSKVKARSQFRIAIKNLAPLYKSFSPVSF